MTLATRIARLEQCRLEVEPMGPRPSEPRCCIDCAAPLASRAPTSEAGYGWLERCPACGEARALALLAAMGACGLTPHWAVEDDARELGITGLAP